MFRFARGEEVTTTHDQRARLSCPLDWLVISDHAEMYGLKPQLLAGDPEVLALPQGKAWSEALTADDPRLAFDTAMEIVASLSDNAPPIDNPKAIRPAWEAYTALPAFNYARVIEIPTPRWTAYEAKRFGVEMSPEVPMITTERAYASPI